MSKEIRQRGSIKRITFDIVYPSGELKTVKMHIHDGADWEKAGLIVFDQQLIDTLVLPGIEISQGKESADKAKEAWNTQMENEPNYPAMLIIESHGEAHARCGGHRGELIYRNR
jgi:hypothetical protein